MAAGIVGHLEGILVLQPARARRAGVGRGGDTNYQGARIFSSAIVYESENPRSLTEGLKRKARS